MEPLHCLSCKKAVTPETVKLYYRVFVCEDCYDLAEMFMVAASGDIHLLQKFLLPAVRKGLVCGAFVGKEHADIKDRLAQLVGLVGQVVVPNTCQNQYSLQTPSSHPPQPSSGEDTPPHVATLAAMGQKSSTSTGV